jgi:hypothetical protein
MHEYYMLTESLLLLECLEFINQYELTHSIHLNRVRFLVDTGSQLETFMLLQFGQEVQIVRTLFD